MEFQLVPNMKDIIQNVLNLSIDDMKKCIKFGNKQNLTNIEQPQQVKDCDAVCSIINTHRSAIEISHRNVIKRINEFYNKEFYDPLTELQSEVVQKNNNPATSFFIKVALEEAASSKALYDKNTFKKFVEFCSGQVTKLSTGNKTCDTIEKANSSKLLEAGDYSDDEFEEDSSEYSSTSSNPSFLDENNLSPPSISPTEFSSDESEYSVVYVDKYTECSNADYEEKSIQCSVLSHNKSTEHVMPQKDKCTECVLNVCQMKDKISQCSSSLFFSSNKTNECNWNIVKSANNNKLTRSKTFKGLRRFCQGLFRRLRKNNKVFCKNDD